MKALWCAVAILISVLTAQPGLAATPEEWRQDIDRIVSDIRATHPAPFVRTGELTFMRRVEAFKAAVPTLSEPQRVVEAMRLVGSLGDGHSRLEPNTAVFARWYPVRFYEFTDGYFITGAHESVADLAGAQVLEIGDRPVAEAADAARALFGADNDFDAMERLYALHNAVLMEGLGYAESDGGLTLRVRLANGRIETRRLSPMTSEVARFDWIFRPEMWGPVGTPQQWISAYRGLRASDLREEDVARPAHLMHRRALYARALPQSDAYYIQANLVGSTPTESFPAFFRRALAEVDVMKPKHLIIDLRYNFGGDGSNVPAMIAEFAARRNDPPWRNLYVLSGRRTFSAGLMTFLAFVDQGATVIGEPAGAPRNHFGDANSFDYPRTGLRMYVSHEHHRLGRSTDVSAWVPVDVPARFSFADYAGGRDPAVDAILAGQEMRSIAAIAVADGGPTAAAVFQDRRARYGDLGWWAAPSEIQLRTVSRTLQDQGRMDQAISVAELNTVVNPQEWRTWMNLGDLLIAAGRRAEGIENFRRSLALGDPTNFNVERLTRAIADHERETAAPPAASGGR